MEAEDLLQLPGDALRLRRGQVDFVDDGQQDEVRACGQVRVRQGLGLDALGGVHDQQSALAGGESP